METVASWTTHNPDGGVQETSKEDKRKQPSTATKKRIDAQRSEHYTGCRQSRLGTLEDGGNLHVALVILTMLRAICKYSTIIQLGL